MPSSTSPLGQIAQRLAARTDLWQPLVRYDAQNRFYTRLAAEPDYEAWLLTWLPGQGTLWHDHGGSAGAFATVQGTLTERHAVPVGDGTARIAAGERRLSDAAVRPFGRQHIHQVVNAELLPAVSVHVYAPSLSEMNEYEAHGSLLSLTRSQLAGVNW
ncbi:cysteine dioxygenase family protein [uncultured Friedmanniella sp.]|uniref:cysteine dioxygenase n=1 Tax=uncultured Friedmanniella sp. TaxID=335381 RepID=UPI0035CBA8D0